MRLRSLRNRLERLEPLVTDEVRPRGIRVLFVSADGEITGEKLVKFPVLPQIRKSRSKWGRSR
jgi:hypothetical protein